MNSHLKKILKPTLILVILQVTRYQAVSAQSLHDSLINISQYFTDSLKDEVLKKTLTEAWALYKNDSVTVPLAAKLVAAEELIFKIIKIDRKMVFSYGEMLKRVLEHLPHKQKSPEYAASVHNLARLYEVKGQFNKSLELYQEALAIRKEIFGEESIEYASTLSNIGFVCAFLEMNEKGLAEAKKALAIRKKLLGEEDKDYAVSLSVVGILYANLGQYNKAIPLLEQSVAIIKNKLGTGNNEYTSNANNLLVVYEQNGEYEKALQLNLEILAIRKKLNGEESTSYAYSLSSLGTLYRRIGEYEKALVVYQQALATRKKLVGTGHPSYAISLHNLATLYVEMGQYHKAMPLEQEALVVTKKAFGEEHPQYGAAITNLAILYEALGDYDKALLLYQQTVAIILKTLGKDHRFYALGIGNIGLLYQHQGKFEKALPLFEEVVAIQKKIFGEENPEYAASLNAVAGLYLQIGDYRKAVPLIRQALGVTKNVRGEDDLEYSSGLINLANAYEHLGQHDQALPLYRQALTIRKKTLGEKHPDYIRSLNDLGLFYISSSNINEAQAILKEADNSELEHLTLTYSSLTEQEKIKFLSSESYNFYYLPSLLVKQGTQRPTIVQQLYMNELALKGMVLENQKQVLRAVRESGDSSDLVLYKQWRSNKSLLGKQLVLPLNERSATLDSLGEVTNQLEQQLSRRFASFHEGMQSLVQKDISSKLLKGEAAVEFLQFKLYDKKWTDTTLYAALIVLPGDTSVHFVQLFEERQLQHLLNPSSKKVNNYTLIRKLYPGKSTHGKLQDSLYLLVWKPLEKHLKDIHTVYYAPAGLLHRIPFNALVADANHLLIDKYRLNQVLSTRSVAMPAPIDPKPLSASLWGNIEYGLTAGNIASRGMEASLLPADTTAASFNFYAADSRGSRGSEWHTLPGTKKEMDNIGTVLMKSGINVTIDSGAVATEEAFKLLDGKSPKLLHLATHGFFLPVPAARVNNNTAVRYDNAFTTQQNPMFRSGLVLAGGNQAWKGGSALPGKEDGILTAYEIAQMDLSNTDLIVLSACETALGDIEGNEGVIGLQRAFKMAGVKQMIVSLWRIPDKETTELMILFYSNWLHGQSTHEALRSAQMKMKEKYPPYYWAAFVLVE